MVLVIAAFAWATARSLARDAGILAGISCGAAIAGMAVRARPEGYCVKTLLAVLPDTVERYIGTGLWRQ
jgi:cysteine synthase A